MRRDPKNTPRGSYLGVAAIVPGEPFGTRVALDSKVKDYAASATLVNRNREVSQISHVLLRGGRPGDVIDVAWVRAQTPQYTETSARNVVAAWNLWIRWMEEQCQPA